MNQRLDGRFLLWAVAGAIGDNLHIGAHEVATPLRLSVAGSIHDAI